MQQLQSVQRWYQTYEKHTKITGIISAIALSFIGVLAFLWRLGSIGLIDETEPMFAEAARQMLVTGDWITPYYNDLTRFDKPPLSYWLMAIAYKIVGVNAWGARLPSALAAIALMVMLFVVLRKYGFGVAEAAENRDQPNTQRKLWLAAWIGSALIALNLQTIVWARTGVSDMLLNSCMGSGLICFFCGYGSGGKAINRWLPNGWYIAAYVMLALAILAKGPVGLVIPGLIILAFLLYVGKFWEVFWEAKPLTGAALVFGISVPWFVLVILRNGQTYIDSFFGYHNLERFTGVVNGHDAPWYFYFPVVLIGFLPWSVYIPVAIARLKLHRCQQWRKQPRHAHLGVFASTWFFVIFGFFTIAVTKLPSYTLPLLPAASILLALLWSQMIAEPHQKSTGFWWSSAVNVLFLGILTAFMIYSPRAIGYDPAAPDLSQNFAASPFPLHAALIWGLATLIGLVCLFRSRLGLMLVNVSVMVLFIAFIMFPVGTLLDQARQAGLRDIAATIKEVQRPNEEIMMIGFEKPTLVFYSGHPIHFFRKEDEAIAYFQEKPITAADSLLFITKEKTLGDLAFDSKETELLQEKNPYKLFRLHHPEKLMASP